MNDSYDFYNKNLYQDNIFINNENNINTINYYFNKEESKENNSESILDILNKNLINSESNINTAYSYFNKEEQKGNHQEGIFNSLNKNLINENNNYSFYLCSKKTNKRKIEDVTPKKQNTINLSITKSTTSHPSSKKKHRKSRRIVDLSYAPSVLQDIELKKEGGFCHETIMYHAQRRLQYFFITAVILYKIAERSNLKKREVSLQIEGAYLQVGQAKNLGNHRYQAAHSNISAGIRDNLRETFIKEIVDEKGIITPKKGRILRCKGFTDSEITEIEKNCYQIDNVREVFNKIWQEDHSIITNTPSDFTLNSTVEVPARVNIIDSAAERYLRPKVLKLYNLLMYGEISPEEAGVLYHKELITFFDVYIKEIPERLALFKNYKENFHSLPSYRIILNLLNKEKVSHVEIVKIFEFLEKLKINNKEIILKFCNKNNFSEKIANKITKNLYKIIKNKNNKKFIEEKLSIEMTSQFFDEIASIEKANISEFDKLLVELKFKKNNLEINDFYDFNLKYKNEITEKIKKISSEQKNIENTIIEKLQNLNEIIMKLAPPKEKKTVSNQEKEEKNVRILSTKLSLNKKFLKSSLYKESTSLAIFSNWIPKKNNLLKKEIKEGQKKIFAYLTFASLQKVGSVLPNLRLLFGEFNPNLTENGNLSSETLLRIQEKLLQPIPDQESSIIIEEPKILTQHDSLSFEKIGLYDDNLQEFQKKASRKLNFEKLKKNFDEKN